MFPNSFRIDPMFFDGFPNIFRLVSNMFSIFLPSSGCSSYVYDFPAMFRIVQIFSGFSTFFRFSKHFHNFPNMFMMFPTFSMFPHIFTIVPTVFKIFQVFRM